MFGSLVACALTMALADSQSASESRWNDSNKFYLYSPVVPKIDMPARLAIHRLRFHNTHALQNTITSLNRYYASKRDLGQLEAYAISGLHMKDLH